MGRRRAEARLTLGPWEGPRRRSWHPQAAAPSVRLLGVATEAPSVLTATSPQLAAREDLARALEARAWPSAHFIVTDDDDGIRLDRWFKRNLPEVSFNIVSRWARTGQLRLDGKRAAPGDRSRPGSRSACRRAKLPPARSARPQRQARAADRDEDAVRARDGHLSGRARVRAQQAAGPRDPGRDQDPPPPRPAARRPGRRGRARPKLVHRLDKDTSGALLVARTRAGRRPFRQGLLRPHRAQGLLGAGRRRARQRRRADRPAAGQAARHRRREDARRRGERAAREDALAGRSIAPATAPPGSSCSR